MKNKISAFCLKLLQVQKTNSTTHVATKLIKLTYVLQIHTERYKFEFQRIILYFTKLKTPTSITEQPNRARTTIYDKQFY